MKKYFPLAVLFAFMTLFSAPETMAQNLDHGREVFRKCAACHSAEANGKKVGPSLYGVLGRKAGSLPGFNFSNGMRDSQITWDEKALDQYLAKPRDFIPGNKMVFAGLSAEADRKDLIAFLRALPTGTIPVNPAAQTGPDESHQNAMTLAQAAAAPPSASSTMKS